MNEPSKLIPKHVLCKKCGTVNLGTSNFCYHCGKKLPIGICPQCGKQIQPMDLRDVNHYCTECGYNLTPHFSFGHIDFKGKLMIYISGLTTLLTTFL